MATTDVVIASAAKQSRATTNRIDNAKTLDCFAALAMTAAPHGSVVGGWHTAVVADGRHPAGRAAGTSTAVGWPGAIHARERNAPTGVASETKP